jgi:cytochrome c-type biogenesis protein CcmH
MSKHRLVVSTILAVLFMTTMVPIRSVAVSTRNEPAAGNGHKIAGKFMCMCGCNQVLSQCNHVGCTTSTAMLKEIDQALERGESEETITQDFVQEFGTRVYAEPPKTGFSAVAWVMPGFFLAVGTLLVILVIARWRKIGPVDRNRQPAPAISPELFESAKARIARETQD